MQSTTKEVRDEFLKQLKIIAHAVEASNDAFIGNSVFSVYDDQTQENDSKLPKEIIKVNLIDFAHVIDNGDPVKICLEQKQKIIKKRQRIYEKYRKNFSNGINRLIEDVEFINSKLVI